MPFKGRAIAHTTYIEYANKYGIHLQTENGVRKSFQELAQEIYRCEMIHVYPKPFQYG